jgi:hypothetical protein
MHESLLKTIKASENNQGLTYAKIQGQTIQASLEFDKLPGWE